MATSQQSTVFDDIVTARENILPRRRMHCFAAALVAAVGEQGSSAQPWVSSARFTGGPTRGVASNSICIPAACFTVPDSIEMFSKL